MKTNSLGHLKATIRTLTFFNFQFLQTVKYRNLTFDAYKAKYSVITKTHNTNLGICLFPNSADCNEGKYTIIFVYFQTVKYTNFNI